MVRVSASSDDVRVLVVDDQPGFLAVAERVIASTSGFRLAGTASSGPAALDWVRAHQPDLVVMDIRMPGGSGVAAALKIAALADRPLVVLCSSEHRPDIAADPHAHGADAFCCKERFSGRLLNDVWAAHGAARRSFP